MSRLFPLLFLVAGMFAPCPALADEFDVLRSAVRLTREKALVRPDQEEAMANAVRGYLNTIDPYSSYITAREYAAVQGAAGRYSGVGMDLLQGPGGVLFCLPYENSPAERAGIRTGDILYLVEGSPASRYPLLVLEGMIRGNAGDGIRLGIASSEGAAEMTVIRAEIRRQDVSLHQDNRLPRIRISRFNEHTKSLLEQHLSALPKGVPLVLDLRSNVGGDIASAVEAAGLFLPENALVVTMEDREGKTKSFKAAGGAKIAPRPLVLWQDAFTASAAEVFCAALKDTAAALTVGQRTYGKGIAQNIIPAGNGDFFVISVGRLYRPGGRAIHQTGLEADYHVRSRGTNREDGYMKKSFEALGMER